MAKKNQSLFFRLMTSLSRKATVSADDYGVTAVTVRRSIGCFYLNTPSTDQALCFAFGIPEKTAGGYDGEEKI
ncbi:MAG: hypothetical protein IKU70_04765 [Clostridia bacterium]|nr:hypothetical protein [Clostridia bacterium]